MPKQDDYSRRLATIENRLLAIRDDGSKTAARFDEIVRLRRFLLDIQAKLQNSVEPKETEVIMKIDKLAITWGQKGDCI